MNAPLEQRADGPEQVEPTTIESLLSLLREARSWVWETQPTSNAEEQARENMLERIDKAAPPPHPYVFERCEKEATCALDKGHQGDCDDIPF